MDLQSLIEEARTPEAPGERAAAGLALEGLNAVRPVAAELRKGELPLRQRWKRTLLRIRQPEALPALESLLGDEDPIVEQAAISAMGRSRNPSALEVLREALAAAAVGRDRIVEAIGELRDPRAAPLLSAELNTLLSAPGGLAGLMQRAPEEDTSDLSLLIALVRAQAKLGDHRRSDIVAQLSRYRRGEEDPGGDAELLRIQAASALLALAGDGVFAALRDALTDPSDEIQRLALNGLLLLGAAECVPVLLWAVFDASQEAALAWSTLHDLTGEWPGGHEEVEAVGERGTLAWWRLRAPAFAPGVCYRFGHPAWPPDLFPLIDTGAANELKIITGVDFQLDADLAMIAGGQPDAARRTAEAWWQRAKDGYRAGGLYKDGREQPLARALSPD